MINHDTSRSWQIGKLMKAGQAEEAATQKKEVESTNELAAATEEELNKVCLFPSHACIRAFISCLGH